MDVVLEAKNITKDFPGVRALDHVSLTVGRGQIHALCGENGAGKSTLINVISGVFDHNTYEGDLVVDGEKRQIRGIRDAESLGIAVIHQELNLFGELSVAENLFMGHELHKRGIVDWNRSYTISNRWIEELAIGVQPTDIVKHLGIAKQQLVEIARTLAIKNTRILILDEPTSTLSGKEVALLFHILGKLRDGGVSCIYISHRIEEVVEIADYVTVLRDGKTVGGDCIENISKRDIVRMMVGREIRDYYIKERSDRGKCILEIEGMNLADRADSRQLVEDASIRVYEGEVLGIFGLVGAGRTELARSIFGDAPGESKGQIRLHGQNRIIRSPRQALAHGIAYVTEDRKSAGIIPTMNVKENISIAFLDAFRRVLSIINENEEINAVTAISHTLRIKTPSLATAITKLSGGNQQKVILARYLIGSVSVLILDEPTRGIDVGAKQEIYTIINSLVKTGVSVVMVSSELPEIIGMCDRILVMREGCITGEFDNREKMCSQEEIMICATRTAIIQGGDA